MNVTMVFGNYGQDFYERVKEKLGFKFTPKFNKSGITFFGSKGRILKLIYKRSYIEVEFNVPVSPVSGLIVLTEKEARDKHMGTCQWIYKGQNPSLILELVGEAMTRY